jgi:hypothetical protein
VHSDWIETDRQSQKLHVTSVVKLYGKINRQNVKLFRLFNYLSTIPLRHMGKRSYVSTRLDLATGWRWVASFKPRPLYPRGKARSIHRIGCWFGPRDCLDAMEKRKISCSHRESKPNHSARSQSLSRLQKTPTANYERNCTLVTRGMALHCVYEINWESRKNNFLFNPNRVMSYKTAPTLLRYGRRFILSLKAK